MDLIPTNDGARSLAGYHEPLPDSLPIAILLLPLTPRIAEELALSEVFSLIYGSKCP